MTPQVTIAHTPYLHTCCKQLRCTSLKLICCTKRPHTCQDHLLTAAGPSMKQKRCREEACSTCGHYHDVSVVADVVVGQLS
jgi:hypothetical protein